MSIFDFFKKRTILDLFVARHVANEKGTNRILKAIQGSIDALHVQMKIDEVEKKGGTLQWDDISYVDDGENQLLILVAVITYPPGAELDLDTGDKIKLTRDTAPYFNRLVRAGIPVTIADKSKEEVLAYLKQIEEDTPRQIPVEDKNDTISELIGTNKPEEKEMTFDEFDLSQLTEEQRKSYQMGGKSGKA